MNHFYFVQEFEYIGPYVYKYTGTVSAPTPKDAVKDYLLYYWGDKETINYVKKSKRLGCNFIVTNCATHKKSYYITL